MSQGSRVGRRPFIVGTGAVASTAMWGRSAPSRGLASPASPAPATIKSDSARPVLGHGIQIGDVEAHRAVIWTRSDRPARMIVEWDSNERFSHPRTVRGPYALEVSDFTARVDLSDLPPGQELFVRVVAEGLGNDRVRSAPLVGRFRTAPVEQRPVRFVWGGDTAGQGFGINPEFGGMRIYETMRARKPDFFIHSGDTIYADGPIQAEMEVEEGRIWRNLTTPETSKVAETLDEFRGNYRYNLLDDNLRRFNAEVPQIWQWDDHEIVNNWSPSKELDERYTVRDVPLLVARGAQAFL